LLIKQIIDDEKLKRQKAIDDWLPISSSRNAKWWYSAFHNVTAMVGAGVLSLPYAMAQLGWYIYYFLISFPIFTHLSTHLNFMNVVHK
jgi:amino acid permease